MANWIIFYLYVRSMCNLMIFNIIITLWIILIKTDKIKHGITYVLMAINIGNEFKIIGIINSVVSRRIAKDWV